MKANQAGIKEQNDNSNRHGYWVYSDGYSYWGIGLYRYQEIPLKCSKELHENPDKEAKIAWHKEESAKIAEAQKETAKK